MPTSTFDDSISTGTAFGSTSAPPRNQRAQLSSTGISPTDSYAHRETAPTATSARGIRKQDVAEVTAQLAIMTRSGVDIATALESLASQCGRPALADVLRDVRESVLAGNALSDALRRHSAVFEPTFIATVAAGEASGRMSEVLQQLAQVQRNEIRSARAIRSLLTYPILLMLVSGTVLAVLILVVLPRFTEIFSQYDLALPVITQMLIAVAGEFTSRWWLWLPATFGAFGAFMAWRTTESGRHCLDHFWLHSPVIGDVCRSVLVGRTCRLLGLMLENGVTLLDSIRLTRQAIQNTLYTKLLTDLENAVVNGQGMVDVLAQADVLPQSAREMIATAERTGNLSEVTTMLGEYYDEEAEAKTRQLVGLLEPIITVVMGVVVATVVLAVMLPVFDLSTLASKG